METLIRTEKSFLSKSSFKDTELVETCINDVKELLLIRPTLIIYGRVCHQNRDVGFFSDESIGYKYSRKLMKSQPLTDSLKTLLNYVNTKYESSFNGILVNRYQHGDSIGKHSDDESGVDKNGVVALSYGVSRKFRIRDKITGKIVIDVSADSMDFIHMGGDFQREFTHEIPVEKKVHGTRYSFTFRNHKE